MDMQRVETVLYVQHETTHGIFTWPVCFPLAKHSRKGEPLTFGRGEGKQAKKVFLTGKPRPLVGGFTFFSQNEGLVVQKNEEIKRKNN